jgi:hypothetical protein
MPGSGIPGSGRAAPGGLVRSGSPCRGEFPAPFGEFMKLFWME